MVTDTRIREAYVKAIRILNRVREKMVNRGIGPMEKLRTISDAMVEEEIRFKPRSLRLFIEDLLEGAMDCDTSAFLAVAIGKEMGWPIKFVEGRQHAFARWEDPSGGSFDLDLGMIREVSGKGPEREKPYKILNRWEMLSHFLLVRGNAKYRLRDFSEAIRDYQLALKNRGDFALAFYNLGHAFYQVGAFEEAGIRFGKAIELDPDYLDAYFNRAAVYFQLGRFNEAIGDLEKVIANRPDKKAARELLQRARDRLTEDRLWFEKSRPYLHHPLRQGVCYP